MSRGLAVRVPCDRAGLDRWWRALWQGEAVLAWGRQILSDYETLRADRAGRHQGLTGTLQLGVVPAGMPAVSALTARFTAAHPATTVEVRSMTSRAIQQGLVPSSWMAASPSRQRAAGPGAAHPALP
ncbi:hypothetical protein [Azospirillum baldaniorum]|uniref:hypothetical protein n=1 Tax=Azospirillum baldaniorum TaxID=1064539 RepID=UPI001FD0228B|nr:hypothetical protein [Azospirillum baldaniorum]